MAVSPSPAAEVGRGREERSRSTSIRRSKRKRRRWEWTIEATKSSQVVSAIKSEEFEEVGPTKEGKTLSLTADEASTPGKIEQIDNDNAEDS